MKLIALIPARSGSKRIPGKNIRPFFGHPLIAYAIDSAKEAGIFSGIYVSTDSEKIGLIAEYYGAKWIRRPEEFAWDDSPDVDWIFDALRQVETDCFMILRPTSPFRTVQTIIRAWNKWDKEYCMKAIQKVKEHPAKMWEIEEKLMLPYCIGNLHLQPYQNLEPLFIQNGSLEIRPVSKAKGAQLFYQPFFTEGYEGFDLNTELDWITANVLVERHMVPWPKIERTPYGTSV